MSNDFILWSNRELIWTLEKWGILSFNSLRKISDSNLTVDGFRKRIHRLAKQDYVKILKNNMRGESLVLPTKKALDSIKSNRPSIDESIVYHNFILSEIGIVLLNRKKVFSFVFPHEIAKSKKPTSFDNSIEPDAILAMELRGETISAAVELEITQKSKDRITDKFKAYYSSNYYACVIYFFDSNRVMNSYINTYNECINEKKISINSAQEGKIMFCLIDPEKISNLNIEDWKATVGTTTFNIGAIFGDKK